MEVTGRKYLLMKAVNTGKSPLSGFVRIQRDKQGKTVLYMQIKKRLIQESGPHVYEVCLYQQDAKPQWVPIAIVRMEGIAEIKEERDVTGYPGAENMALMLYVFRRGENTPLMMAIENESLEDSARQITRYPEPRSIEEKRENRSEETAEETEPEAKTEDTLQKGKAPAIAGFAEAGEISEPEEIPEPEESPLQLVKDSEDIPEEQETPAQTAGSVSAEEAPQTYWGRTREFYLGLFSQGQSCRPFEDMFPDTEWVVIQPQRRDPYYGAFDHYLVGLVKPDKKVKTIIYAVPGGMYWMPPAPGYGFSRFIPVDPGTGMGYWLCFLDAETGKACW
mgnify:CR=1 FL=1